VDTGEPDAHQHQSGGSSSLKAWPPFPSVRWSVHGLHSVRRPAPLEQRPWRSWPLSAGWAPHRGAVGL